MPIDAFVHAQMKNLMMRKKSAEEELTKVRADGQLWKGRVQLAQEKNLTELAVQAEEKLVSLRSRRDELKFELEKIEQEKDVLRYQARRPSGDEVERAEFMVEQVRQGGLIDPDKAGLERELAGLVSLDFDTSEDDKT
jgi:phage shock protein A